MKKKNSIFRYLIFLSFLIGKCYIGYAQNSNPKLKYPELENLFFKNSKFSEGIWVEIPNESDYQAYMDMKQNPVIYQSGMPQARITIGNTLKNYNQRLLSFLTQNGYAEIITIPQNLKSSYGDDIQYYHYIFYKKDFKNFTTFQDGKTYVNFGIRHLNQITYVNEYEDAPMGMKRTFYSVVFNYKISNNVYLNQLPEIKKLFEGRAKAFKDPDDGRWKVDKIFDNVGVRLSDNGKEEFLDFIEVNYPPFDYFINDKDSTLVETNQESQVLYSIDSTFTGFGKFKAENGDVYEGEWLKGKKHGKGKIIYKNGFMYDGEWIEDKRDGHGITQQDNVIYYEGQWKNDKYHGRGRYFNPNGVGTLKYQGDWINGKYSGKGRYEFITKEFTLTKIGDFFDGKLNGGGTEITNYTNGETIMFDGEFKADLKINGIETRKKTNGEIIKYSYKNGNGKIIIK